MGVLKLVVSIRYHLDINSESIMGSASHQLAWSKGKNDRLKQGADPTAENGICPQYGIRHGTEINLIRRNRDRRRIIVLSPLCIIAAVILVQPIVSELSLAPAQKMLVSADDMGPGWESTDPERRAPSSPGATGSAWTRPGYDAGQTYIECSCYLTLFSAMEHANATYLDRLNNIDSFYRGNMANIPAGDRTESAQMIHDGQVWQQAVVMQKGSAVVSITMQVLGGTGGIDPATVLKLVEAQAEKIP